MDRPKLILSGVEYSKEDEDFFRRNLENYLLSLSSTVHAISTGNDTGSSLLQKRGWYAKPVGTETI